MIGEIDQDGNGCISFNEFLYLMTKNVHEDGDIEEEIRLADAFWFVTKNLIHGINYVRCSEMNISMNGS